MLCLVLAKPSACLALSSTVQITHSHDHDSNHDHSHAATEPSSSHESKTDHSHSHESLVVSQVLFLTSEFYSQIYFYQSASQQSDWSANLPLDPALAGIFRPPISA